MIKYIEPRTLWTVQKDLYIENDEWWAKLRVQKYKKSGQDYYDILGGKKGSKAIHYHQGIGLDTNSLFLMPRNVIHTVEHKVESELYGKVVDEKIDYNTLEPAMKFDITIEVKSSSRESKIIQFKFPDQE